MACCLVCGTEFPTEADVCPDCGTGIHVLVDILRVHNKPRFLFGSAKSLKVTLESPQSPPQPPRRKVPRKPPPQPVRAPMRPEVDPEDMIVNRDSILRGSVAPPSQSTRLSGVFLLDLLCCLLLDATILAMIIWVSPRSFGEIITFSLIPVMFVLLTFTILYYWLFMGLFQKTLGRIIMDKIGR